MKKYTKCFLISLFDSWFLSSSYAQAGTIATDGTMGAATTLTGPNYTIPQDLGATVGNNLFHSFGTFNLNQGDVATFTGVNTIQNVISHVTDGNPSSIDGTIQSQVGNANFFFINPAGIIFGQHAAIDVPAAFHASTANELRFADGTSYNLHSSKGSLTVAPPESFGFLGKTGDIVIEGSQLKFKDGAEVSFTGGSVTSNNATIEVPRGSLRVYSNGDAVRNVSINGELPAGDGAITMNGGSWETSGDGGGNIQISGGAVSITSEAKVFNDNTGSQNTAGSLRINANTLLIDSSIVSADASSTGNAGNVFVTVTEDMQVLNRGQVSSDTYAAGSAGNVEVHAGNLMVKGEFFTGISSDANAGSTGHAGYVDVKVDGQMQILNGGQVSSDTNAAGDAGYVEVHAGSLMIKGDGVSLFTGISSDANYGSTGHAGYVDVKVDGQMQILNGGKVSSSTYSTGATDYIGYVEVTATSLIIDSQNGIIDGQDTGIFTGAYAGSTHHAGNIKINVARDIVLNSGGIASSNLGEKDAGEITISVGRLFAIIDSYTTFDNNGNMTNYSGINTTAAIGNGGSITIKAPAIYLDNSQITTSVGPDEPVPGITYGDGGDITLNGGYLVMNYSYINANTAGQRGGNIFINTDGVIGNSGQIEVGGTVRRNFFNDWQLNVIQAAAENGVNGDVILRSPDLSAAAALTGVSSQLSDLSKVQRTACAESRKRSSLRRKGRGGMPKSIFKPDFTVTQQAVLNDAVTPRYDCTGAKL